MITINLLPPQQRKAKETKELMRKLIFASIFLTAILIISWFILFISQQMINQSLSYQKQEIAIFEKYFNQESNKKIEQDIENVNKILTRVSTIEKNKSNLSNILIELIKTTTSNISFYNIKIVKSERKITMNGFAKTRDDFLKFKNDLEKSEYFDEIVSPPSNIINPENINFSIEAKLSNKALSQQ